MDKFNHEAKGWGIPTDAGNTSDKVEQLPAAEIQEILGGLKKKPQKPHSKSDKQQDDWISVSDHLPPSDSKLYPIVDSDGEGDFSYGSVICSDYESGKHDTDPTCRILRWLDHPLPSINS